MVSSLCEGYALAAPTDLREARMVLTDAINLACATWLRGVTVTGVCAFPSPRH